MTKRSTSRRNDPDQVWRGRVLLFALLLISACFVLYVITGATPSTFVGAGVALVGTAFSPKLASLFLPNRRDYEPPPDEIPDVDWARQLEPHEREERQRRPPHDRGPG